ncbi:hypothetical protein [Providencia alcalifaciens]|uniref:hypothetical protein n=1 Tax=Providencia alcalifaciens TaxID=126385 RepID=UPI001CC6EFB9|nr:hypothetical protein [Providencia alcalifaciens]CAG9432688.1 hypothetical protein NVI2019_GHJFPKLH_03496 [Providencia alcalifaciens]
MQDVRQIRRSALEEGYLALTKTQFDKFDPILISSYRNLFVYFQRIRDAQSCGYLYINSELNTLELIDIINAKEQQRNATRILRFLMGYTSDLYSMAHQSYQDANIMALTQRLLEENGKMQKKIEYLQAKLDALQKNNVKSPQLESASSSEIEGLGIFVDDMLNFLKKEIGELTQKSELMTQFIHYLDEIDHSMLLFVAVNELWMNDFMQYTAYTDDNADFTGLEALIEEHKAYFTYFAS